MQHPTTEAEGFQKPLLKVAAETWAAWATVHKDKNGTLQVRGPIGRVLEILATVLQFNYEIKQPPDGEWGAVKANGNWSGMIGMLKREEVDLALGPFNITPQRETACDFTIPIHNDNGAIFIVRPGITKDISGFLKPFTFHVWLLILVSSFTIGATMISVINMEANIFGFSKKRITGRSIQWVITTIAQESSEWMPTNQAGRLVVTTWLLASLVFMSSYSGILTAMLTLPKVTIPVDTLEDLVSQSQIPWRFERGTMARRYLLESEDPIRRKVANGHSGFFSDCYKSRREIARGDFAALCDDTTMKFAMNWDFSTNGRCNLYITRESYNKGAMNAVAFRSNSPYISKANRILFILKESGILSRWVNYQIANASECLKPPTSDRREGITALDLKAITGPLLLVLGGLLVGVISFISECLVFK